MIKKISAVATAPLPPAFLLSSCSFEKNLNISKDSFTDIQPAEPQYLYMQTMLPAGAKLIRWEEGYLLEKNALAPNARWKRTQKFTPDAFVIKKEDAQGIKEIPVKYIEGYATDDAGAYSAFTLKLGPSMNSSVAFYSNAEGRIIYNHVVTDRPQYPPSMMSISIRDTYFGPKVSPDGRYFAVTRYNYMNISNVRVYENGKWDKYEEIEYAAAPCFAGDKVYCKQFDPKVKKSYLVSREFGKKQQRVMEIKEMMISLQAASGRVFLVTPKGVNEYIESTKQLALLFDFSQLSQATDNFEIADVYLSGDKEGLLMFVVYKKKEGDTYSWRLAGRRI